ncbi:hypothetical protein ACWEJ6_48875 [Nonomuraea sp. NPDC004702]
MGKTITRILSSAAQGGGSISSYRALVGSEGSDQATSGYLGGPHFDL